MNRKSFLKLALAGAFAAVLAGCATGAKYTEMASSIPTLKPGEGRVYFIRTSSMVGGALQPEIRLNGQPVGVSQSGGFFYVDRPAGNYVAAASTETEKTLSFTLAAGETKYVRSSVSLGVMVGRLILELETPEKGKAELANLSYSVPKQ